MAIIDAAIFSFLQWVRSTYKGPRIRTGSIAVFIFSLSDKSNRCCSSKRDDDELGLKTKDWDDADDCDRRTDSVEKSIIE